MFSIYGDSILKFVLWEDGKYRVNHEGDESMENAFGEKLLNRSCFGSTAGKGLNRLRFDVDSGKKLGKYCILEFGGNDCSYDWPAVAERPMEEHKPLTPPVSFVNTLKEMIAQVRKAGSIPVLTNLVPMLPKQYFSWITRELPRPQAILEWLGELGNFYRQNELYSLLCTRTAGEEKVGLIDIRSPFLMGRHMETLFCSDGIHPNREGQTLIWRAICDFADREVSLA